jgi:hypothetical protein
MNHFFFFFGVRKHGYVGSMIGACAFFKDHFL